MQPGAGIDMYKLTKKDLEDVKKVSSITRFQNIVMLIFPFVRKSTVSLDIPDQYPFTGIVPSEYPNPNQCCSDCCERATEKHVCSVEKQTMT